MSASARLGYTAVRVFRQAGRLTYNFNKRKARTAAAKECGVFLYVAEFYKGARYPGYGKVER